MKKLFFIIASLLYTACSIAEDINLTLKNLDSNKSAYTSLNLSSKSIDIKLNKTTRGNGTVEIYNSLLRLYDERRDTFIYSDGYLRIDTKDFDNDNLDEIVVSGVALSIDDETGEPTKPSPVLYIYKVDFDKKELVQLFRNSEVEIDLTNL